MACSNKIYIYFLYGSILLFSFSCVHKNADKEVWKDLLEKVALANANKNKYKESFFIDSLGKASFLKGFAKETYKKRSPPFNRK